MSNLLAANIHAHSWRKLGKAERKFDSRNIQLSAVLRAKPPKVPKEYSILKDHPIQPKMYGNDTVGDCVIAEEAEHQSVFELIETGKAPNITTADCLTEYWRQTNHQDTGLVLLDALNQQRTHGLYVASTKRYYKIAGFAEIKLKEKDQLKLAIDMQLGAKTGIMLPSDAFDEIDAGKPWSSLKFAPGSLGGHCIYLCGYTVLGPVCLTWGQLQQMTWPYYFKYVDENYVVFDALDSGSKAARLIDVDKFIAALHRIAA